MRIKTVVKKNQLFKGPPQCLWNWCWFPWVSSDDCWCLLNLSFLNLSDFLKHHKFHCFSLNAVWHAKSSFSQRLIKYEKLNQILSNLGCRLGWSSHMNHLVNNHCKNRHLPTSKRENTSVGSMHHFLDLLKPTTKAPEIGRNPISEPNFWGGELLVSGG